MCHRHREQARSHIYSSVLLNQMMASGYLPHADYASWNLAAPSGVNLNASHVIQ
jgi:hypothetical protein